MTTVRPNRPRPARWLLLLPAALLLSCPTQSVWITSKTEHDPGLPPGSLAVVIGQRTAHGARLAALVTDRLRSSPALAVLSQEETARLLPVYPSTLADDAFLGEPAPETRSFSDAHRAVGARVRKLLGTDYVLLLWFQSYELIRIEGSFGPGKGGYSHHYYHLVVCGRLLRFPDDRIAGTVYYDYTQKVPDSLVPVAPAPFLESMLVRAADSVSKRLLAGWPAEGR